MLKSLKIVLLAYLTLAVSATAQEPLPLDASCSIRVGNRTAQAQADGTYVIENVRQLVTPAGEFIPQLFRARATCRRNRQMVTGQSDFFTMQPNENTFVAEIFPGEIHPIPGRIEVAAPADIVPRGGTVQIEVTATFFGFPTPPAEDRTVRAAGTTYLSTNTDLLTVSDDGLVTGTNASSDLQTASIIVLNEGRLATLRFTAAGEPDDLDDDGLPNDYEELFGLDPLRDDADGDLDGDGLSNLEEFRLGTLPDDPDTDRDGIPDPIDGDPLAPDEAPPTVAILEPADGGEVLEGEVVTFRAEAADEGLLDGIELLVNGASFGTSASVPFEVRFTVPFGAEDLRLEARASDSLGQVGTATVSLAPSPDPGTEVRGEVVEADGSPAAGAEVRLFLGGFRAELFDFDAPLAALPDLTGREPDLVRSLPRLDLRNPENRLSPDTFGAGFGPDFAVRLSGLLDVPVAGIYTFFLGADDGAVLRLGGTEVARAVATGSFAEAVASVVLDPGEVPIEVEYFQSLGAAELTLRMVEPPAAAAGVVGAGPTRVVGFPQVRQDQPAFRQIVDSEGRFAIPSVPTLVGDILATAASPGGSTAAFPPATPRRGEVTDLGRLELPPFDCLELPNPSFEEDPGQLLGWNQVDRGNGAWSVQRAGEPTPFSNFLLPDPPAGQQAAATDQNGPGSHFLFIDLDLPARPLTLAFELLLNNRHDQWIVPADAGLDHTGEANQQVRVDLLDPDSAIDEVGDGVLLNLFATAAGDPLTTPYQTVTADLSPFAGERVRLRFAEVDNQFFLNMGVDDVRICRPELIAPRPPGSVPSQPPTGGASPYGGGGGESPGERP